MLSLISDARATEVVLAAATDPRSDIRSAGLVALANCSRSSGEPLATQALYDPDDRVREAAIECLAELGGLPAGMRWRIS